MMMILSGGQEPGRVQGAGTVRDGPRRLRTEGSGGGEGIPGRWHGLSKGGEAECAGVRTEVQDASR